jgi:hypothetical protein
MSSGMRLKGLLDTFVFASDVEAGSSPGEGVAAAFVVAMELSLSDLVFLLFFGAVAAGAEGEAERLRLLALDFALLCAAVGGSVDGLEDGSDGEVDSPVASLEDGVAVESSLSFEV